MTKNFNFQINTVEKQFGEINERELQLVQAINRLAEIITHIANKQKRFSKFAIRSKPTAVGTTN